MRGWYWWRRKEDEDRERIRGEKILKPEKLGMARNRKKRRAELRSKKKVYGLNYMVQESCDNQDKWHVPLPFYSILQTRFGVITSGGKQKSQSFQIYLVVYGFITNIGGVFANNRGRCDRPSARSQLLLTNYEPNNIGSEYSKILEVAFNIDEEMETSLTTNFADRGRLKLPSEEKEGNNLPPWLCLIWST